MQNALRLGIVLLFLVITIKSHAALPPSTQPIWPTAQSLAPNRISLSFEETKRFSSTQFQQKIKETRALFPKKNDSQLKASGQLPAKLLESGHELRELQKLSQNNPTLTKVGFDFFIECSQDETLIETLHSVCLSHALKLSNKIQQKVKLSKYPQQVVELAKIVL
jgi:ribosomal protein L18E